MTKVKANPNILKMWTERTKCWMCKYKFDQPVILPVEKIVKGKLQPNINVKVLFHLYDTHGLPPDIVRSWIIGSVYEQKLHLMGAENFEVSDL